MSDDYKIYVDAGQPATLNDGADRQTDCATLQEAVLAWHRFAPDQKIRAAVKVVGGPVYGAHEIERLPLRTDICVTPRAIAADDHLAWRLRRLIADIARPTLITH